MSEEKNIIIYNTQDGKASVSLMTSEGTVWMNQSQLAELFDTSKQNISQHIISILEERELREHSVVKDYLTTAAVQSSRNLKSKNKTVTNRNVLKMIGLAGN